MQFDGEGGILFFISQFFILLFWQMESIDVARILVSCRSHTMLIQEPASDPKCSWIFHRSLPFPHPLNYLICAKDIMIILLLKIIRGIGRVGERGLDRGDKGFLYFFSVVVLLLILLSWLVHDNCWIYFFVSFFFFFLLSLSLVSLIRCYSCIETVVFVL